MTTEGLTIDSFPALTVFDANAKFYVVSNDTDYQMSGSDLLEILSQNLTEEQLPESVVTQTELTTVVNTLVTTVALTAALEPLANEVEMTAVINLKTHEFLNNVKTLYVRKDGNDSNTGLTNDAAGAFLTIQRAANKAASYDFNSSVTAGVHIFVAPGLYEENLKLSPLINGFGINDSGLYNRVVITGDIVTPSSTIIKSVGNYSLIGIYGKGCDYLIEGFKIDASTLPGWNNVISIGGGAIVTLSNLEVDAGLNQWVFSAGGVGTKLKFKWTPLKVSGSTRVLINSTFGADVWFEPSVLTFEGSITYGQVVNCYQNAMVEWYPSSIVNGAGVVGPRFGVGLFSAIDSSGGGVNAIPGTIAGTTDAATSGIYF